MYLLLINKRLWMCCWWYCSKIFLAKMILCSELFTCWCWTRHLPLLDIYLAFIMDFSNISPTLTFPMCLFLDGFWAVAQLRELGQQKLEMQKWLGEELVFCFLTGIKGSQGVSSWMTSVPSGLIFGWWLVELAFRMSWNHKLRSLDGTMYEAEQLNATHGGGRLRESWI